jgi:bis(5'-nucleosyl)-tetraphosphatase (symmetrical)
MEPTNADAPPRRRILIGDVQGCREELEALLEEAGFDPSADRLRPVGDLVNRGPDSLGVLRLLYSLDAHAVLGNHDLHLLAVAAGERRPGPGDTLAEILEAEDRQPLLGWLAAQPLIRSDDDLFQVHAGLSPAWDDPVATLCEMPGPAEVSFATRVRRCDARGRMEEALERGQLESDLRPWFDFYRPERHQGRSVVFGHWAARGLVRAPHLIGLDTGCVWGGALSAWIPEERRLIQVPARRTYRRPGACS